MSAAVKPVLSSFAQDVAEGLSREQKQISSQYFYDDLGSALFEAITLLPEYGLTRADERLLQAHARHIAAAAGPVETVCELGSGSGKKTRYILEALREQQQNLVYRPIDVSAAALEVCQKEVADLAQVRPVCADWMDGLREISRSCYHAPLLLLFLGSSIGNLERAAIPEFLTQMRANLRPGDLFLIGFDLVKDLETMLNAYDDATGVTAAFNLNLLNRINRELDADFDLRAFAHEAIWNSEQRRIEMHLLSGREQTVSVGALEMPFRFEAGETIWTESSHKFLESELTELAYSGGFHPVRVWTDRLWPFAEALWSVRPPS